MAGSHVLSGSKAMQKPRHRKNARTKGIEERYTSESGTSASSLATNRLTPKGGVMPAMVTRILMMTPNQIRFQPNSAASGRKMAHR